MKSPVADILWPALPRPLPLAPCDVHVWAANLNVPSEPLERFRELLSPDEHDRAARFQFDLHRHRYIAGRGFLRTLLADYCPESAAALKFTYSPGGKPTLEDRRELHFNLSHSGDLALIAITRIGPVGVDVEPIRTVTDASDLVKRFFSPQESAVFHDLPDSERAEAFFNLWTRKEALLKATGEGIAGGLNRVEVSFLKGEPACVRQIGGGAERAGEWNLVALAPAPGWVGAAAVRASGAAPVLSAGRCEPPASRQ